MASLRWLTMALMVVAVPLMGGSGPGVAKADEYLDGPPYLQEGSSLSSGWILGGNYTGALDLHLKQDCNLVLYPYGFPQNKLWSSNTAGKAEDCILVMQPDCNAVLYEKETQKALWASQTAGQGSGCFLVVQDQDGNAVVYDSALHELWDSRPDQP